MGILRTILALLVVGSHLHAFGGAAFAVKSFFIISGFYMALVINTRYYALPISSFYGSRLLRLLPLYWIVGLLTLIAEIVLVPRGQYFDKLASPLAYGAGLDLSSLPLSIIFYIGVSLATMLGLDTGLWLGFDRVSGGAEHCSKFRPWRDQRHGAQSGTAGLDDWARAFVLRAGALYRPPPDLGNRTVLRLLAGVSAGNDGLGVFRRAVEPHSVPV